jgi:hypothetical protein
VSIDCCTLPASLDLSPSTANCKLKYNFQYFVSEIQSNKIFFKYMLVTLRKYQNETQDSMDHGWGHTVSGRIDRPSVCVLLPVGRQ